MEALEVSKSVFSNIPKGKFDSFLVRFIIINLMAAITPTNSDSSANCSDFPYETFDRKSLSLPPGTEEPIFLKTITHVPLEPLRAQASSKRVQKLSLETLFPEINVTSTTTPANFNLSSPQFINHEAKIPKRINLTSVLLNHGFNQHNLNSETSEALDRFVFSNLPQGSKLVLKTVKIVRTDDDGNEEPMGDPAVSLDVSPIGSTDVDPEEHAEAENSEDESDEQEEDIAKDLASEATHHSKTGSSYGGLEKEKERSENYHRGKDYGKDDKQTLTDTQGKKVTNYKGHEKGVTDFDNEHGNAQSNDGERYKKSKKKNKGRKVTGFKRVYHKEEYQRTEHFYDDEEAKKIAESYGLAKADEKKEHGKKDDHRKYHGTRVEHEDGKKVKNEHATHQGHNKGHHVAHGNHDKYKQSNHHASHHQTPNYDHQQQHYSPPQHQHPNHNYKGAYSNPKPKYDPPPPTNDEAPAYTHDRRTGKGIALPLPLLAYPPTLQSVSGSSTRIPVEEIESDEMRVYHAERDRKSPDTYYYAPNFGPPLSTDNPNLVAFLNHDNGAVYRAANSTGSIYATTPRIKLNEDDRYAKKYPSPKPLLFDSAPKSYPRPYHSVPYYPVPHGKNFLSIDKAVVTKIASETYREPPPNQVYYNAPNMNWNPISSGSTISGQTINLKMEGNGTLNKSLPLSSFFNQPERLINGSSETNATSTYDSPYRWKSGKSTVDSPYPPRTYPIQEPKLQRLVPYIRFRTNEADNSQPSPPPIPNLPINTKFYYGPTLIQHSDEPRTPPPPAHASPSYSRRGPGTFSNFMNNLMNSVSDFFTRIG